MSFQPFAVGSGLVAWRMLQRTLPQQMEAFSKSAQQERSVAHFKNSASDIRSADDLVADRISLNVALSAYGLKGDLNNRYFIKRILAEGATDPSSLANRMADTRYSRFSGDLALDGLSSLTGILPSLAEKVTDRFLDQEFAAALGESQPNLRLALNAQNEMGYIASRDISEDAKWFLVMGNPPLRNVFEKALGLPSSFGQLDIEKQLDVFRQKASDTFGVAEIDELAEQENTDKLIDRFLLRMQVSQGLSLNGQSIALQLLLN